MLLGDWKRHVQVESSMNDSQVEVCQSVTGAIQVVCTLYSDCLYYGCHVHIGDPKNHNCFINGV